MYDIFSKCFVNILLFDSAEKIIFLLIKDSYLSILNFHPLHYLQIFIFILRFENCAPSTSDGSMKRTTRINSSFWFIDKHTKLADEWYRKTLLFGLLSLLFYHQPKFCFTSDLKDSVVILMNSVEVVMKLLHDGILPEKVIIGLINEYKNWKKCESFCWKVEMLKPLPSFIRANYQTKSEMWVE